MSSIYKPCPACGGQVVKSAKLCPHCGKKLKMSRALKVFLVIMAFVVTGALLNVSEEQPTSPAAHSNLIK